MHNLPALSDLRLICEVMRQGSLAAAAAALGASPSFVSKRLALLEAKLGTRLLHRTTRRIVFTDDGETVYRWAQRILADVDGMAEELSVSGGTPRGSLRVSASPGFGRKRVAPALSEFAVRYPMVEARLEILDRPVDPIAEGMDVDIRVGGLREPHLHAHRLAGNERVLCAAPSYLARHGRPGSLAELAQHRCLVIREPEQAFGVWRLQGPAGAETVKVRGSLSANDGEIIHRWALDGHGIMLRSRWDVAGSLATGQLVRVLEDYSQEADVWAVYPTRLSRSPKVRIFVRFLTDRLVGEGRPHDDSQTAAAATWSTVTSRTFPRE
jgi:LysR family transcriptional regulator, transcriptional activator for dmlA